MLVSNPIWRHIRHLAETMWPTSQLPRHCHPSPIFRRSLGKVLSAPTGVAGQLESRSPTAFLLVFDGKETRMVVFVEPHELGQVDPGKSLTATDFQQILIILMDRVLAHVCRARINDGILSLRVYHDKLVVNDNWRVPWVLFARKQLQFRFKSFRNSIT